MMILTILFPIAMAVINWITVYRNVQNKSGKIRFVEYVTKPFVILALLGWLWSVSHFSDRTAFFAAGLLFAMVGDILLMFPKTRYTMFGALLAFMLTHIFYIVGLNPYFPPKINIPGTITFILVVLVSVRIYLRLIKSSLLLTSQRLLIAVTIYILLVSLMLVSCLYTYVQGETWKDIEALLVGCGGLLFFVSDTILAWNLYVRSIPNSKLINRIAYHCGQIAITLGIAIHFTPK